MPAPAATPPQQLALKEKMVVLIGGGGFLGRYVAQALLKAGARVRIAQRDPRDAYFLRPLGGLGQTQFVAADVARPATIARALVGVDAAVNLVGTFTGNLTRIHVDGARAVAEAASANGLAALVQISAIGADAQAPSVYGRTKAGGEAAARAAYAGVTILRPSTVFGREDKFVNLFAGLIAKAPLIPVFKPDARFQPVFAGDVAAAITAALADPEAHGGRTYELGGPEIFTMLGLQQRIAQEISRKPVFLPLPDTVGGVLAKLPGVPMSADQWRMLSRDAVVAPGAAGLDALGVRATPFGAVAPGWLVRYRKAGRFAALRGA